MRHQRGFILPMIIFSLAIMGVLVLAIVGTSDDDRTGSRYDFEGTRSFYAAETGMADILTDWKANNYEGLVPNVGNTTDRGWVTISQGGGSYHAVIQKIEANTYMVTVDGQTPGARKGLRTVQMMLTPGVSFRYVVQGTGNVKFSGSAGTDSYDSDVGTYNVAGNKGADGDIYSATSIAQLPSGTPAPIQGDTKSAGSIVACGPTYQSGTCDPNTTTPPAAPAPVTCPVGPTYNDLTVGATTVLDVPPTAYYYHNLTVSGGSARLNFNFTTNPKQHVDVWISGQFKVQGGAQVNNLSLSPVLLTIWGCGADATTWTISGGSNTYLAIYAPKHPITLSGGTSDFFGAFVGAAVTVSSGHFHYDEALTRVPSVFLIPGSWTEITR
jgi:hypothetical protein